MRAVWNWAVMLGFLEGVAPTRGIRYPKTKQKPPFMTMAEINSIISRGGLSENEAEELWNGLFLAQGEVLEILDYVQAKAAFPFIYPMFAFVALTGARRSEMLRSRIEDIQLDRGIVQIREKKRDKSKDITFRSVEICQRLAVVMKDWLAQHPGGIFTFCQELKTRTKERSDFVPLTINEANHHFHNVLAGSKWAVVRGFHVFRHSFVSNLAAAGIDQRIIDEFTGHQTDAMRRRYRHLFPDQRRRAIESVFGVADRNGK